MIKNGLTQSSYHVSERLPRREAFVQKLLSGMDGTLLNHAIISGRTVWVDGNVEVCEKSFRAFAILEVARSARLRIVNYGVYQINGDVGIAVVFKTEANAVHFKILTNGTLL